MEESKMYIKEHYTEGFGKCYGIEKAVNEQTYRLFHVLDSGNSLGQTLLASPYLNTNKKTLENKLNNIIDPDEGVSNDCLFWEIEEDKEQSQTNFRIACEHYRKVYGVRGSVFD